MDAHCVTYGSEALCTFKDISRPVEEIIVKILNFKYELLDISKLLSLSEDVCTEIEHFGETLVILARKTREKCCCRGDEDKTERAREPVGMVEDKLCGRTNDLLSRINVSLTLEQEKNDKFESDVAEMRLMQEERLTRLEKQVKQAESRLNAKLNAKKLDRRKEQVKSVLKSAHVYDRHPQKGEGRNSPSTRILGLPSCISKASDQGYEHTRIGRPATPRSLKERKSELQLQEEIKWSRITPIPVHISRRRSQHLSLSPAQKKT